jgi:hypothetical protein
VLKACGRVITTLTRSKMPCIGLLKTNCLAGHIGFEPANPSARYLIGIA